ncbi:MAG: ABC transporter permease [Lachnospiraceae bacterium]|nr:ABC transporter permease [Lachnospiraceae bacterium]
MRGFFGIIKRNMSVYFKDIHAVIFSLLTSIIVFVLYLLFIKGTFVNGLTEASKGLEGFITSGDIEMFSNGFLLTGIMGSALITISYSCASIFVKDRETRVEDDVLTTPIRRAQIAASYYASSSICSFIMTSIIFTVGLLMIKANGDIYMTAGDVACAYGLVFLGSVSATAFFMVVVTFFKSVSASSAFYGILSAASGFVIGAYIPISEFSVGVKTFCNIFPASHVTVMFRNVMLNGILNRMNEKIGGLDNGAFVDAVKESFTFQATLGEKAFSLGASGVYVAIIAAVCSVVCMVIYSKNYKRV